MGKIDSLRKGVPYRQMWRIFERAKDNDPELSTNTGPKSTGYKRLVSTDTHRQMKKKMLSRGVLPELPAWPKDFKR